MSKQADNSGMAGAPAEATPEAVSHLLDLVAGDSVEVALSDLEQMLTRLRADAEVAAEAREVLRTIPVSVLREALRLRTVQIRTLG